MCMDAQVTEGNMARPKGSKNKNSSAQPEYMSFTVQQRIEVLANVIVDRIESDQKSGKKLIKRIEKSYEQRIATT